jgi:WS/DGAT/MGAT family acyltransferase
MSTSNGHQKKTLSAGDSLFLYLEREASPITIGAAMEFDGIMRLPACLEFVKSKLPLIPRYTERVVFPSLNSGYPVWEPDPTFDIRNHVREIKLQHGTEEEFKAVVSDIFSVMLDRNHPLWDITLMRELKGNRTGVLARVHHCLADGIAGVGLMNVLMDTKPTANSSPRPKAKPQPQNNDQRDAGAKLLQQLVTSYLGAIQGMLQVQKEVLSAAEILAHAGRSTLEQMLSVAPEIAMPAERLPFNKLCRGPQKFAWTSISMKPLLAIKEQCDCTLNDVMLGIMTLATRKYAELHKVRLQERLLRIIVPVNIRGNGDVNDLGNRISFAPVNIPMDIADPRQLLDEVKLRTRYIKQTHLAEYVGLAGMLITSLPIPLQAMALPYAGLLPISLSNFIFTNVPGPQVPLYFMGHKMLTWYPHVPIGGEMGVNTAVLTYNGSVYFGFTIDVAAAPDADLFETLVPEAFAEFLKALKVRTHRAPRPKRVAKKRRAKAIPTVDASSSHQQAEMTKEAPAAMAATS